MTLTNIPPARTPPLAPVGVRGPRKKRSDAGRRASPPDAAVGNQPCQAATQGRRQAVVEAGKIDAQVGNVCVRGVRRRPPVPEAGRGEFRRRRHGARQDVVERQHRPFVRTRRRRARQRCRLAAHDPVGERGNEARRRRTTCSCGAAAGRGAARSRRCPYPARRCGERAASRDSECWRRRPDPGRRSGSFVP